MLLLCPLREGVSLQPIARKEREPNEQRFAVGKTCVSIHCHPYRQLEEVQLDQSQPHKLLMQSQSPAEIVLDQSGHAICMSVLVWDRSPQPAACFLVPAFLHLIVTHYMIAFPTINNQQSTTNNQQPTINYHHRSKKPKHPQLETGSYKYIVSIHLCSAHSYLQLQSLQIEFPFSHYSKHGSNLFTLEPLLKSSKIRFPRITPSAPPLLIPRYCILPYTASHTEEQPCKP